MVLKSLIKKCDNRVSYYNNLKVKKIGTVSKLVEINENRNNSYDMLKNILSNTGKGVYIFVKNGKVKYVGEAHERDVYDRIRQHFSKNDTGRNKELCDDLIKDYNNGYNGYTLYVVEEENTRDIKNVEQLLICLTDPDFNKNK